MHIFHNLILFSY